MKENKQVKKGMQRICLGEKDVLAGLARAVEARFKLTLTGGDDDNTSVGLGSTGNHVRNVVLVARGVEDGEALVLGLEVGTADFHGNTLRRDWHQPLLPWLFLLRWYP